MLNLSVHQLFNFKVHLEGGRSGSVCFYESLIYGRRGKILIRDLEYSLLGTRRFLTFLRETLLLGGEIYFVCTEKVVREFFLGLFRRSQGSIKVSESVRKVSSDTSVYVLLDEVDTSGEGTIKRMTSSIVLVPLNETNNTAKLDCISVFTPRNSSFKCWVASFVGSLMWESLMVRKVF